MTLPEKRLNAFRPDLADARLRGLVDAETFVEGRPARVVAPVADVLKAPDASAGLDTQLVAGDDVRVFAEKNGWAWLQAERDSYVGYVATDALGERGAAPTHVVSVPRTFVYPAPDMKFPRRRALSMGSRLAVAGEAETRNTRFLLIENGEAVIASHLAPAAQAAPDYVAIAERLLETPYLWGGASGFGIDCSGLVQLSMRMAGVDVLRDTDMQLASIGRPVDVADDLSGLQRGDLVFWKGHVAIMTDAENMVHASGHTMLVCRERLSDAVARIGHLYGTPVGFRRP